MRGRAGAAESIPGTRLGSPADLAKMAQAQDVTRMVSSGIPVYFVIEDAEDRGLGPGELVSGAQGVPRAGLARLLASHDRVWHW